VCGTALGSLSQAQADPTLELLLGHGINHIDTAASYGDAELRLAPWLARNPGHFFLATKTGKRDYAEARGWGREKDDPAVSASVQ
jgi:aryl-alcohol dehydrogenase-like predicted oxidoreductase